MSAVLPSVLMKPAPNRTRLRALVAEDHSAVQALLQRHGASTRSQAGWNWALFDNPVRRAVGADAGWVLEHGDQVVGFLGNLPLRCHFDGLPVWGATCTTSVVDEAHRAHSVRLIRAFAAQPGAAFVYAADLADDQVPHFHSLGFAPVDNARKPGPLRWTAHHGEAWAQNLRHVRLGWLAPLGRAAAGPAHTLRQLKAERVYGQAMGLKIQRLGADELDGSFASHWPQTWNTWANAFWSRPGLWSERSAYLLSWRLSDPDRADDLALWALRDASDRMLGMCLARKQPAGHGRAAYAELVDWALAETAPAHAAGLLLQTVLDWARSWEVAVVEAGQFTGEAALQLERLHPHRGQSRTGELWLLSKSQPAVPNGSEGPTWSMTAADHARWFEGQSDLNPRDARPWRPAGVSVTAVSPQTRAEPATPAPGGLTQPLG